MSDAAQARRTKLKVYFDGVDISADINKYIQTLTYTDTSVDSDLDDLQIVIDDREDLWLCSWLNNAIEASAVSDSSSASGASYKVTAKSGLNVRTGPGTSYSKLGALAYGTVITVSEISNGWAATSYSGQTAYVYASYLAETETPSESTSSKVKGMEIQTMIVRENWDTDGKDSVLDCGVFELDSVKASGPPSTIAIKATSIAYSSSIRQTKKSRAWEKCKLSSIANEIASTNGMACMYESSYDPLYERVEQITQSDIAFLQTLCENAGISLKATSKIIVLFDQATYESKAAAKTITKGSSGGYLKYELKTGQRDTQYASCHVSYTDPSTGKTIEYTYTPEDAEDDGQVLEIREKVSSAEEAKNLANKRLRQKNKFEYTGSFTYPGDPTWVAGITVTLAGWGAFDGKYIVEQATHSVSKSGYTTKINVRQVLEGY